MADEARKPFPLEVVRLASFRCNACGVDFRQAPAIIAVDRTDRSELTPMDLKWCRPCVSAAVREAQR